MARLLERLLAEAKRHPGDGGVLYYAHLAKQMLATLDEAFVGRTRRLPGGGVLGRVPAGA